MDPLAERGRRLILAIAILGMAINIGVTLLYIRVRGTDRLPSQVVRFFLEGAMYVFIYRGASWARWLAVVLLLVAGGLSLFAISWLTIMLGSAFFLMAATLAFSPSVAAYFAEKNKQPVKPRAVIEDDSWLEPLP